MSVTIQINGDAKQFEAAASDIIKGFKNIAGQSEKAAGVGKIAFGSFIGILGSKGVSGAIGLASSALSSLNSVIKEGIGLASSKEDAVNALNESLVATGKFSPQASKSIQDFAGELQSASRFGDDLILKNASIIQSLGNLDEAGLKRATQAAADFAVGTKKSFDTASELIAKAASGQIQSLAQYGIMVEQTGDKTKDFESALTAIEQRFGGRAKEEIKTFSGAMAQLGHTTGSVKEGFGILITQNPAILKAIQQASAGFSELGKFISENKTEIMSMINVGLIPLIEIGGFVVLTTLDIAEGFDKMRNAVKRFESRKELEDLEKQLQSVKEANKDVVDFRSGERIKTFGEKVLETRIQQIKGEEEAEGESFEKRRQMFEGFSERIKEIQNGITDSLASTIEDQKALDDAKNEDMLDRSEDALERMREEGELEKELKAELNEEFRQQLVDHLGVMAAEEEFANLKRLQNEGKFSQALLSLRRKREALDVKQRDNEIKLDRAKQREVVGIAQETSNFLQAIDKGKNKAIFFAQKGLAAAQVIIQGAAAASAALAPPPLGAGPIAGAGLATLINIKTGIALGTIAATTFTEAFDGGQVEGGSIFRDTEPFLLSKGEVIVPRKNFEEVIEGTARERGFVKEDEEGARNQGNINISVQEFIGDESYINVLVERIRDAVQFRNADLGV